MFGHAIDVDYNNVGRLKLKYTLEKKFRMKTEKYFFFTLCEQRKKNRTNGGRSEQEKEEVLTDK